MGYFPKLEYVDYYFENINMHKYYKHIELPSSDLVNEWTERMRRIKIHYNVSKVHGVLSDIYTFRKLTMYTHRYVYLYVPVFELHCKK